MLPRPSRLTPLLVALTLMLSGWTSISEAQIKSTHPRLLYRPQDLANAQAKAAAGAADWTRFINWVNVGAAFAKPGAADYILAYHVTGNASYLTQAEQNADGIIADMSEERGDSFFFIYKNMKHVAMAYDWLYDNLTPSKRTAYINYMNQAMDELWNYDDNPTYTWNGWGTSMPGNNYFYKFIMATTYASIALYGENPSPPTFDYNGNTYNDLYAFLMAKLNEEGIPYLTTRGVGGGWHEGVNYRLGSYMHMFESFIVLRNAGDQDYFTTLDFANDAQYFCTHIIQPGNSRLYPGGDLARESSAPVSGFDTTVFQLLSDGLAGTLEGLYAQDRVENIGINPFKESYGLAVLTVQNRPSRSISELPLAYLAQGLGFVNSRSSWQSDAISVSFISADRIYGHQHFDQNSFVIWKDDWLAIDSSVYSKSGLIQHSDAHNTLIVDGWGQRMGDDTGEVTKYELTNEYSYVVGNSSDAYYGGNNGRKDLGDPPLLTHFERELVHAFPDVVVVFDRVTPVSAGSQIKYLIHSRSNPSVQGNLVTATNGGKMFHRTLLPTNASLNTVAENHGPSGALSSYRVEVTSPATANHLLLNVMHIGPSSASTMPATQLLSAETGNMVGTKIDMGSEDGVFMFSTDPGGGAPGTVSYEVGFATPTKHQLMNLKPATQYSIVSTRNGPNLRVRVSEGPGRLTSEQGVLHFRTGGAPDLAHSADR